MPKIKTMKTKKYSDVMKKKRLNALKTSIILRTAPIIKSKQAKMFKYLIISGLMNFFTFAWKPD